MSSSSISDTTGAFFGEGRSLKNGWQGFHVEITSSQWWKEFTHPKQTSIDASRRVHLFFFTYRTYHQFIMSSPPRVDFPTSDLDDVDMDEPPQNASAEEQSLSIVPQKLFLEGTPSVAGTPARQRYAASAAASSPLAGIAARRAVGMSTPRRPPRTPLFARA